MRFLVDQNLSSRLAQLLVDAGHDAVHVRNLGLATAPDTEILAQAVAEARVVISGDTDFGALLAAGHRREPSVILFRRERPRRAEAQAELVLSCLDRVREALLAGSIVVIEESRIRVRSLPVIPE